MDRPHAIRDAAAMKLAVVLNPNALGVRRAPGLADRLRRVTDGAGEVVVTRTPGELAGAARRFAADGVGLVAACGGDGTNLSTVTELVRAYGRERLPAFAILRGGTVNTIAQNLDIHGKPEEILTRLVAASRMVARFLEAYYGGIHPGVVAATLLTARTVVSSFVQGRMARWLCSPADV